MKWRMVGMTAVLAMGLAANTHSLTMAETNGVYQSAGFPLKIKITGACKFSHTFNQVALAYFTWGNSNYSGLADMATNKIYLVFGSETPVKMAGKFDDAGQMISTDATFMAVWDPLSDVTIKNVTPCLSQISGFITQAKPNKAIKWTQQPAYVRYHFKTKVHANSFNPAYQDNKGNWKVKNPNKFLISIDYEFIQQ